MTLKGFVCVLLGRVERPIFVKDRQFDVLYHIFQSTLYYNGETLKRIDWYCESHFLTETLNHDQIVHLAIGYLLEKQEDHSLTEIEALELNNLLDLVQNPSVSHSREL